MIRDHLGQPTAGHGVQHPEAAVVGVSALQGAPEVHLAHSREPCLVEQPVGLIQAVEVRVLGVGQLLVGGGPLPDQRPLLRGALGRKIPQDAGFHGCALIDQLLHNLPVQPGDGGTFVGHDLHQPVFLQPLQDHPDEGTRCPEPGAERVFAQQAAGADGQVDDLPLQHFINFGIRLVCLLFHSIYPMFHGSSFGFSSRNSICCPVSGCRNCSRALCRAMFPLNRLPYLPSPQSGCFREANCTRI